MIPIKAKLFKIIFGYYPVKEVNEDGSFVFYENNETVLTEKW